MSRLWAYTSLALPPGVALARRPRGRGRQPAPPSGLVLCTDGLAAPLAVPLGQLCRDASVPLHDASRPGSSLRQWAEAGWLEEALRGHEGLVVLALGAEDLLHGAAGSPEALAERLRGRQHLWITPPLMPAADRGRVRTALGRMRPVLRSEQILIPRGPDGVTPTAAGYAAWAGAIWRAAFRFR